MAVYIPSKMVLPVSKGADLIVDFMLKVDDIYTNYAPSVTVTLEVDIASTSAIPGFIPPPPTTISAVATISTYHAVCRFEWPVADTITSGSLWRCIISYPTVPDSTENVPMNGTMTRYDGN